MRLVYIFRYLNTTATWANGRKFGVCSLWAWVVLVRHFHFGNNAKDVL